jgi:hypothetical protein
MVCLISYAAAGGVLASASAETNTDGQNARPDFSSNFG